MAVAIKLEGVSKIYKLKSKLNRKKGSEGFSVLAVDNIDLEVNEGEIFGFLGENGAGKTTIMKMLVGLIVPTSGTLEIFGNDIQLEFEKTITGVASIIEEPKFFRELTGLANLKYFSILEKGEVDMVAINNAVELVGLSGRIADAVSSYSLGMNQRLGLALAIMFKPRVMILDEPINGLDPTGIIEVRNLLKRLAKEYGVTVLISSHILGEMQELCDRVGIIKKGKLIAVKEISEINQVTANSIISINCDEPNRAKELIEKEFEGVFVQITDKGIAVKMADENAIGRLNKLLIMNDINVFAISNKKRSLEELYEEIML